MAVNLVPLSTDEVCELQGTVVDKMLELNKILRNGCDNPRDMKNDIAILSKLSKKIAKYQRTP